eukprot:TRINITY_DN92819_c0_g1_i1.p1 TRINITY_DN92819_c0_g1~~TRINITY_DN92819_c0_g1_i1.p1  ORF type:complete len:292 (+),score=42.62 TRINITY_DN92819_c0_g1_i1:60-878(+)
MAACGRLGLLLVRRRPCPRVVLPVWQQRSVSVFPQWPYDKSSGQAKVLGDPDFRWPPSKQTPAEPVGEALDSDEAVEAARLRIHRRMWAAIYNFDWGEWERCVWELRDRSIPYDEVTYVLLIHGYLVSHRHSSENAFTVLEEMRQAEVHPALVRMQERFINMAFDLQELGCRPMATLWLAYLRTSYHCSVRFQKKRQKRLRAELESLEPDEALALGPGDVKRWISRHDQLALPPPETGAKRFLPASEALKSLPAPRSQSLLRSGGMAGMTKR